MADVPPGVRRLRGAALKANALTRPLPARLGLSRPVIVKHPVAAARYHGADAVPTAAPGKGNDQVRFEVSTRALAPDPR